MIEVKSDGLYWEGKCYKSLSGLAMAITEYPISGYVFFHKEIAEWTAKITKRRVVVGNLSLTQGAFISQRQT